jgi:hypothetical protein
MTETKYVVIKTTNFNSCFIENNKFFDNYLIAISYRDKKREIEEIEKSNCYFSVASFTLVKND